MDPYSQMEEGKQAAVDSPFKGEITEAKVHALESIEASHHIPLRDTQLRATISTP